MAYELAEHRHRFSAWAAARATQRGLCDVAILHAALEKCGVVSVVRTEDLVAFSASDFEGRHREWCDSVLRFLKGRGVARATFGHATKLIGMYLKSMIVLGPWSDTTFARVAHPPIDSILLTTLSNSCACGQPHPWAKVKWTRLGRAAYYDLIAKLRSCVGPNEPFWKLERFWSAVGTGGPNQRMQRTHSRVTSRAGRAHGPRHAARR